MLKHETIFNGVVMCLVLLEAIMAHLVPHKFSCCLAVLPTVFVLGLWDEWPDVRRVAGIPGT